MNKSPFLLFFYFLLSYQASVCVSDSIASKGQRKVKDVRHSTSRRRVLLLQHVHTSRRQLWLRHTRMRISDCADLVLSNASLHPHNYYSPPETPLCPRHGKSVLYSSPVTSSDYHHVVEAECWAQCCIRLELNAERHVLDGKALSGILYFWLFRHNLPVAPKNWWLEYKFKIFFFMSLSAPQRCSGQDS